MPSKYGFETEQDRVEALQKSTADRRRLGQEIDERVIDILNDYAAAMGTTGAMEGEPGNRSLVVSANPGGRVHVQLSKDAGETVLHVIVHGERFFAHQANAEWLRDVLQRETTLRTTLRRSSA